MANINLKELKYDNQLVLVEMARKALCAKSDIDGNDIKTTYATKAEIGALKNLEPIFLEELPAEGNPKYLYFIPKDAESGAVDSYNEYIWVASSSSYELIGNSEIDISGKLDKLTTAGNHVYSHNGDTQSEIAVDTTAGGTASSGSLITSGAVNAGLATKVDQVTSAGIGVYAHDGSTQNTIAIDTTAGGTASSTSLISSGAVNAGLATKQNSSTVLTSIASQSTGTGLLKLTNGVASLDTNQYALASDLKVTATDVTIDW